LRIAIIALCGFALSASPAFAHADHDVQAPRSIQQVARDNVVRLVSQAKLPSSWSRATVEGTRDRTSRGARQVVVTFRNNAERSAAKRLLHVVLAADGGFVSADHVLK
jgi:hypothetical protein